MPTGRKYYGVTQNFGQRMSYHINSLLKNNPSMYPVSQELKDDSTSVTDLDFKVLYERKTKPEALELERTLIENDYDCYNKLHNIAAAIISTLDNPDYTILLNGAKFGDTGCFVAIELFEDAYLIRFMRSLSHIDDSFRQKTYIGRILRCHVGPITFGVCYASPKYLNKPSAVNAQTKLVGSAFQSCFPNAKVFIEPKLALEELERFNSKLQ